MKTFLQNFLRDETGASAAEYALILAIVGTALGGAALYLGITIQNAITTAGNEVSSPTELDNTPDPVPVAP